MSHSDIKMAPKQKAQFKEPLNPRAIRERELWSAYVEAHPEFKDVSRYPVLIENQPGVELLSEQLTRLTEMDELSSRYPVVIHPMDEFETTEGFVHWMNRSSQFDWLLFEQFELAVQFGSKNLTRRFLHQLGTKVVSKGQGSMLRLINKRFNSSGVILFFNHRNDAEALTEYLTQGQFLQEMILDALPEIKLETQLAYDKADSDHFELLNEVKPPAPDELIIIKPTSPYSNLDQFTVYQSVYQSITNYLYTEQLPKKHKKFGPSIVVTRTPTAKTLGSYPPNTKVYPASFTLKQLLLEPVSESVYQEASLQLRRRSYELALKYGDFSLPTRSGKVIRTERLKLVGTCETIASMFESKVGAATERNQYDTSEFSELALIIFLKALYEQEYKPSLTLKVLPELYELFFELGCIYEPLGLALNEYLGGQIRRIKRPEQLVSPLAARQRIAPELANFNAQLIKMNRELIQENPLTEADYREVIAKVMLPKFERTYARLRNKRQPITIGWETRHIQSELLPFYIGLFPYDQDEFIEDFFERLNPLVDPVIRADWSAYPLAHVSIRFNDNNLNMEYTLHPVDEALPSEAESSSENDTNSMDNYDYSDEE